MPTRQNARLAERRRLRKVLALHAARVPLEEIASRMNAKQKTILKMLASVGIDAPERQGDETTKKGA